MTTYVICLKLLNSRSYEQILYLFYNIIQPFYVLVFLRKFLSKKIDADLLIDREINQPPSTRDTLSLYI